MAKLYSFVFKEKNIELKLRFFLDYFYFVTSRIGRLDYFELENQITLVEKILFQALQNETKPELYIAKYFAHHLFNDTRFFLKNHPTWITILELRSRLANTKQKLRKNLIQSPEFREAIEAFIRIAKPRLFQNSVREVVKSLKNAMSPSDTHATLIYHAEILVSALLLKKKAY